MVFGLFSVVGASLDIEATADVVAAVDAAVEAAVEASVLSISLSTSWKVTRKRENSFHQKVQIKSYFVLTKDFLFSNSE